MRVVVEFSSGVSLGLLYISLLTRCSLTLSNLHLPLSPFIPPRLCRPVCARRPAVVAVLEHERNDATRALDKLQGALLDKEKEALAAANTVAALQTTNGEQSAALAQTTSKLEDAEKALQVRGQRGARW